MEAPLGWTGRKAKGHLSSSATWPTGPAVRDARSQPSSTSFGSPGLPCHRRGNRDAEKGIESAGVTSTSADRRPGQPRSLGRGPVTRARGAPSRGSSQLRLVHRASRGIRTGPARRGRPCLREPMALGGLATLWGETAPNSQAPGQRWVSSRSRRRCSRGLRALGATGSSTGEKTAPDSLARATYALAQQ